MMRTRVYVLGLFAALSLGACGGHGRGEGEGLASGKAQVGGDVVATVDGRPITLGRVRDVAASLHISPKDALAKLEEEELLASEAARRGYGNDAVVASNGRKAAVQMLLREEVEEKVVPSTVSAADVERAFDAQKGRFEHPEQRVTVHILFALPAKPTPELEARAERLATEAIADLRGVKDWTKLVNTLNGTYRDKMQLYVEQVPPLAKDAAADKNYMAAINVLTKPGVVDHAVRSRFGWHAIAVTEIQPPTKESLSDASPVLRKELVLPTRTARVSAFLAELKGQTRVTRDESAIAKMSTLEFQFDEK